jgi:GDP-L-fucose synthase
MKSPLFSLEEKVIYIAGIHGLAGSAIKRRLDSISKVKVVGHTSKEFDLRNLPSARSALEIQVPDVLVIAAAKVGGIAANNTNPVDFLESNLLIQTNLLQLAYELKIPRVLFLGSSCIYPKYAEQPIKEDFLLTGSLEPTNQAYAVAKIAGIELVKAYRNQYGMNWISAMPCNLYGPGDNFANLSSHVIPGLMQRFHKAKSDQSPFVEAWGTGSPLREFLYIEDFAEAIIFLLENYNGNQHINVGSGEEISIRDLTNLIAEVTNYEGKVVWNSSYPDGTPRKILDSSLINSIGWSPKIPLRKGLIQTYGWFQNEISNIRIAE